MTPPKRAAEGLRRLQQGTTAAQAGFSGLEPLPPGYFRFFNELKGWIRTARVKATLSANRELIALYWRIGRGIVERHRRRPASGRSSRPGRA